MALHQLSEEATTGGPQTKPRRCFIAVRPRVDIGPLRALLAERRIETVASYERPWIGARPLDTVIALIEDADLVIGVLDDQAASTNIAFELGFAFARDKMMLLIVPRGAER